MKKLFQTMTYLIVVIFVVIFTSTSVWSLDAPTITATAKGPNQINLIWSAVTNPGWGYKVEIQSNGDTRYSSWTELPITRNGRNYLPYWVTESHYKDVTDGSGTETGVSAQFQMYGLKYGVPYNFRVRTYGKTDAGVEVYGIYSNTASATTTTPSTIRYVAKTGDNSDGTSWAKAWTSIRSANRVSSGTLVLIGVGDYASDEIAPTNSGTQANRTVYQANYGETVTITSRYTSYNGAITLTQNYIIVDGVNVTCPVAEVSIYLIGTRCAIVNSEINGRNRNQATIMMQSNSQYNLVHYCYLHDVGVASDQTNGSVITHYGSNVRYNVIQYSNMRRGGHDTGLTGYGASYNQWKNNLHDGGWGLGWECAGSPASQHNLFEGNVVKDVGTLLTVNAPKPGIELSGPYNTARRNLVYDGKSVAGQYCSSGVELSSLGGIAARYNLVYNNVFVNNGRIGCCFFDGGSVGTDNNTIANNIFYANTNIEHYVSGTNPIQVAMFDTYTGNMVKNNLILGLTGGVDDPTAITNVRSWIPVSRTTGAANTDWTEWDANITTSPDFINYAGREFHLKSTSGLRGQGVSVTDATWGTVNEGDIGAFKYYNVGGDAPTSPKGLRIVQ